MGLAVVDGGEGALDFEGPCVIGVGMVWALEALQEAIGNLQAIGLGELHGGGEHVVFGARDICLIPPASVAIPLASGACDLSGQG